ncbi:hypothetical protein [Undibacterium terreum]|uniref:Uncharacterized protein n=1 Tax=Undibacterium terreum TaxID=1224302 RepID=A0A916UAE2_9BURK|nr:hypothetical protein [Undibacterium terreum]GGC65763.1 hypothetical protein GCM10011396_10970 [Undibacterium terreum]
MKFGNLKSLAHNVADSMASGLSFVIGIYEINVFAEAAASEDGHITIDFLTGATTGAIPSDSLRRAIFLFRDAIPQMCEKHGIELAYIKSLVVRFGTDSAYGPHFRVTVENSAGKRSTEQYVGTPGQRLRLRNS